MGCFRLVWSRSGFGTREPASTRAKSAKPPSLSTSVARSFEAITESDLIRLADIAKTDREQMFRTNDRWYRYEGRLIAVALARAQHSTTSGGRPA